MKHHQSGAVFLSKTSFIIVNAAQCHFLFVRTQCNDCHEFRIPGSAASKSLELKVNPWPIDSIAVSLLKIITLTAHAVIRSIAFHQKWGSCSFSAKSFSKTFLSSTKQLLLIKIAALKDKCKVTIKMILSWDNFEPKTTNFCLNEQQELSCFRCGTSVRNIFPCASKSWHQASCRVLVI